MLAEARPLGHSDLAEVFVDGTTDRARQKAAGGRSRSEALGHSRGGLATGAVATVEASGRPVALASPLAGQRPDRDAVPELLAGLAHGRVRRIVGDRGMSAGWPRREVEARGAEPRLAAHPRHPPASHDRAAYARRPRVENFWARAKEFRAGILVAATLAWLKA